jgi:hypothetical protein
MFGSHSYPVLTSGGALLTFTFRHLPQDRNRGEIRKLWVLCRYATFLSTPHQQHLHRSRECAVDVVLHFLNVNAVNVLLILDWAWLPQVAVP